MFTPKFSNKENEHEDDLDEARFLDELDNDKDGQDNTHFFDRADDDEGRPSLGARLRNALFGRDEDDIEDWALDSHDLDDDSFYNSSADDHIYDENEADLFNDPTRPDGEQYDEFL